ncbi:hypothetical protein GBAR_LOCUS26400, partial [Geodia barretti]
TCTCFVSHSNTHTRSLTNAHTLLADIGVISEDCWDKVMLPLRMPVLPKYIGVNKDVSLISPFELFHCVPLISFLPTLCCTIFLN